MRISRNDALLWGCAAAMLLSLAWFALLPSDNMDAETRERTKWHVIPIVLLGGVGFIGVVAILATSARRGQR